MAFLENFSRKLSSAGQEAVQQAKNMTEINRLNSLISENTKRIDVLYSLIGEDYYRRHHDDPQAADRARVDEITGCFSMIRQYQEQIKQIKESVRCPRCGARVPASAQFCSVCGSTMKIEQPPVPAAEEKRRTCPSCGAVVEENMKFCISCGTKLTEEEKQEPAQEAAAKRKCPVCGEEVDDSMLFCVNCGTKLEDQAPASSSAAEAAEVLAQAAESAELFEASENPEGIGEKLDSEITGTGSASEGSDAEEEPDPESTGEEKTEFSDPESMGEEKMEFSEPETGDPEAEGENGGSEQEKPVKKCPRCNAEVSEDDVYCSECGAHLL